MDWSIGAEKLIDLTKQALTVFADYTILGSIIPVPVSFLFSQIIRFQLS